jgi:hypothetical protein
MTDTTEDEQIPLDKLANASNGNDVDTEISAEET